MTAQTHRFLEAKVGAQKGEGHGDPEPQSQNGDEGAKGDGCGGTLHPQDQVHQEEVCKDDPGACVRARA